MSAGTPRASATSKQAMLSDQVEKYPEVIEGLKELYRSKIRPLEESYMFPEFASPSLEDSDLDAVPMVLLLGQYSVGKTSFIRYMVGRDVPGARIGPEPTTDRTNAIMHGREERIVPGAAACAQADRPFTGLNRFGVAFLSKFEVAELPAPMLERVTFIDTPGVLSGEKQRARSWEMTQVCSWFAERSDMVLLLFDAHKLDISDEFKEIIQTLRGHDDKVRIVLNKADMISAQQLMRVYGALMWSLGKVFQSPETLRVYVGSFWDSKVTDHENSALFEKEEEDLMHDLRMLPHNAAVRKINELVKRARLLKVHVLIIAHLKASMPSLMGKSKKQKALIDNLLEEFKTVMRQNQLAPGDFPALAPFQQRLQDYDFSRFPKLVPRLLDELQTCLSTDIPRLLEMVQPVAPELPPGTANPFDAGNDDWEIGVAEKEKWDMYFVKMGPVGGKLTGVAAKPAMAASQLDVAVLRDVWRLADIDADGHLDSDEFAVAMHLIQSLKNNPGSVPPATLPRTLVPPSKRAAASASPF
eukprot:c10910_g1_i1.p1 GENE.c10910_g1_i1~~c10910_g1_i1.p1  ORF type:complete len:536 (+),score=121.34 c10910_g1_i1:27-1610(+)